MSPEVATRAAHGRETDVWGIGVMLYTMLVGRPPFETDNGVRATLTRVVLSDVKFPPSMSHEAKDLVTSLLRKNPRERLKLSGILDHPFMMKNTEFNRPGSSNSSRTDSNNRWISSDSGISSSYQTSSVSRSQPPPPEFLSSSRVPIINGALRRGRPESPPRSIQSRSR